MCYAYEEYMVHIKCISVSMYGCVKMVHVVLPSRLHFLFCIGNGLSAAGMPTAPCQKPNLDAAIVGEGSTQYFVICESKVLCEVPTLQATLFTAFSAYYCFSLECPASAKNIFCFSMSLVRLY